MAGIPAVNTDFQYRVLKTLKYRLVSVGLALMFFVFNVGLPIVVASCPMMKHSTSAPCCASKANPANRAAQTCITSDRSCCKVSMAAERNKNEFLQVGAASRAITGGLAYTPLVADSRILQMEMNRTAYLPVDNSPPHSSSDLPVLLSSLLV